MNAMSPPGAGLSANAGKAISAVGVSSMTGFARVDGAHEHRRWTWEVKSVNGRGLEIRFRTPPGFDDLETELRRIVQKKLKRGSVSVNLALDSAADETRSRINEAALENALAMVEKISARLKCDPPRAEGILALRGVIEPADESMAEEDRKALIAAMVKSFGQSVDALIKARAAEGKTVSAALSALFDDVARLAGQAASLAEAAPAVLRERIAAQLDELLAGAPVPEERLAQEAALMAVKADVREELDRLRAHVEAGRALLSNNGPAGRQLDFLSQELNREANTLCAKASDLALKRVGLDLKKVIDQLREQVQNVE